MRDGDWKFIPANAEKGPSDMGSGANPQDTRFAAARITEPLLFNLKDDPTETRNLATQMPEKLAEMQAVFDAIHDAHLEARQ